MPAVNQSPGSCGCTTTCSGQICLNVTKACGGAVLPGATVAVARHSDGSPIGSTTTDASGNACIAITEDTYYDILVSSSGCGSKTLANQHCTCTTNNFAVALYCAPLAGRKYTVLGCAGKPLPGATITLSGPAGASGTTDSNGQWTWFPTATGTYTETVSPPPGPPYDRFNNGTGSVVISNLCTATNRTYNLSIKAGYRCCGTTAYSPPFPIPDTLTLSDPGGSASVTSGGGCNWYICLVRPMDHASTLAFGATCYVTGGGIQSVVPSLSTLDCTVLYYLDLNGANQTIYHAYAGPYRADCLTSHSAYPTDSCATWRISGVSCNNTLSFGKTFISVSAVINSWYPFSATYTFATGGAWVTSDTTCNQATGDPYASTLTLNE